MQLVSGPQQVKLVNETHAQLIKTVNLYLTECQIVGASMESWTRIGNI